MENKPLFQTIKTSLKSVIRSPIVAEKLEAVATKANDIMTHTLMFMKLYLLKRHDEGGEAPKIESSFVLAVMKTVCKKDTRRGRPLKEDTADLMSRLRVFYEAYYKPLMAEEDEKPDYVHMNTVLECMANEIVTMYANNIRSNFFTYAKSYVDASFSKRRRIREIEENNDVSAEEKKRLKSSFLLKLQNVTFDALSGVVIGVKRSHPDDHAFIEETILEVTPTRALRNRSRRLDIKENPLDYIQGSIFMMKRLEREGEKIFNVFPLKTKTIKGFFRLDTTTVVQVLFAEDGSDGKKTDFLTDGNLKSRQREIWSKFFALEKKPFHTGQDNHDYTFHHQVETDGLSCSILLIRKDKVNARLLKDTRVDKEEEHVDEIDEQSKGYIRDMKVVAIDPNMSDLIFCVDSDRKSQTKLRLLINFSFHSIVHAQTRRFIYSWTLQLVYSSTLGFVCP